jgi:GntR family transcriptional regulator/MocR family aminotransferase
LKGNKIMWITIERESELPLIRQIYDKIREMISDGSLVSGQKLPSTRTLSKELGVSRNTVLDVYNQMIAEGYLEAYQGSGTIVAEGLQELKLPVRNVYEKQKNARRKDDDNDNIIDFRSGIPALEFFPQKEWARIYQEVCSNLPVTAYGYCDASGVWKLREEIARYLLRSRGISCSPERMIITSGSTQGLSLIANLLNEHNKKVIVENPSHPGLRKVITSAGCMIEAISADNRGLNTDALKPANDISFFYTTPSHQYPLGGILSIQRRLYLIQYAEENNCYIVEDDYDSEFRYEGQPVSSLYELNPDRVIYIGSFSKILAPAIRLGFIILPDKLLTGCKTLKVYSDVHTDALTQNAMAEFIHRGRLEKHIWKMKKHYSQNRNHMLRELTEQFPDGFEILGQASGLHMVIRFHNVTFSKQLVKEITRQGVHVYPIENYLLEKNGEHRQEILMGYSHLTLSKITEGLRILSNVIRSYSTTEER